MQLVPCIISLAFKEGIFFIQVTLRLVWMLQNVEALKKAAKCHQVMFGTVDTWLLYKLTGGRLHVTDVSNASATGFYDPFTMKWADWVLSLFSIPSNMLPEVWDTAADFGCITNDIVGAGIPIRSLVCCLVETMRLVQVKPI
jgi:glycerol kinase